MAPRRRPVTKSAPQQKPSENHSANLPHKKPKTRGASLLKSIAKEKGDGNRLSIELNAKGQPTGKNAAKLATYIGTIAKKWVPITIDNWNLVSPEQRNVISEDVMGAFILSEDMKGWVLKKVHALWKNFKKDLGRRHMFDKETGELRLEPPTMYDTYITQDLWTEFIKDRQTEEFKEKSEKGRLLSQHNDYTYRGSRKGYVGIEEE